MHLNRNVGLPYLRIVATLSKRSMIVLFTSTVGCSGVNLQQSLGGQFRRKAPKNFLAVPTIFQFLGGTLISYIDESGTDFKVQTAVSVKRSTGEKTKRGRS